MTRRSKKQMGLISQAGYHARIQILLLGGCQTFKNSKGLSCPLSPLLIYTELQKGQIVYSQGNLIFQGVYFRGVLLLIPMETYSTCDFLGEGVRTPSTPLDLRMIIFEIHTVRPLLKKESVFSWQALHVETREFSHVKCSLLQVNVVRTIPINHGHTCI